MSTTTELLVLLADDAAMQKMSEQFATIERQEKEIEHLNKTINIADEYINSLIKENEILKQKDELLEKTLKLVRAQNSMLKAFARKEDK